MNEPEMPHNDLYDLIDRYLSGLIGEAGLAELEAKLLADEEARMEFARYCGMETDLRLAIRARAAGKRALRSIGAGAGLPEGGGGAGRSFLRLLGSRPRAGTLRRIAVAVAVLAAAAGIWALAALARRDPGWSPVSGRPGEIAWLVNAQDCRWAEAMAPTGDMQPGTVLLIERGLAEVGFRSGARVILEGPASLELLSGAGARLRRGKATARVPESARGFTIFSPQGKVVDLGTEFGISVAEDGSTEVFVFQGQIEAAPAGSGTAGSPSLTVGEGQAALLSIEGISLRPDPEAAGPPGFARRIVPPWRILPRALKVDFRRAVDGTIPDSRGAGTGLTHRLPGTGGRLKDPDANLRLRPEEGRLELTATVSDINTQFRLGQGEYIGARLSDLGFQGAEDFAVTVSIPDIPAIEFVGQFGLYAGARSDRVIRGGLISRRDPDSYSLFLVNNDGGRDSDLYMVGLLSTGDDLRLTLRRTGGKYSLTVENRTTGGSSTLAIPHPRYLDAEKDLFVGIFAANPRSEARRTLKVQEFEATVWSETR